MFQFYSTTCKCELISEIRKALIALNCCYSLIASNGSPPKSVLNESLLLIQSHHKIESGKSDIYESFSVRITQVNHTCDLKGL